MVAIFIAELSEHASRFHQKFSHKYKNPLGSKQRLRAEQTEVTATQPLFCTSYSWRTSVECVSVNIVMVLLLLGVALFPLCLTSSERDCNVGKWISLYPTQLLCGHELPQIFQSQKKQTFVLINAFQTPLREQLLHTTLSWYTGKALSTQASKISCLRASIGQTYNFVSHV